jgi:hypothetical protein
MGTTYGCLKVESEEERILKIMTSMALTIIESSSAYKEFINCFNETKELDFFLYHSYVGKIVGDNIYSKIQTDYFKNISNYSSKKNIKKIGIMIICLSNGNYNKKIELLTIHFLIFYLNIYSDQSAIDLNINLNEYVNTFDSNIIIFNLKEFIFDVITCNTDDCINAFQMYMGSESTIIVREIWKSSRKKKLLKFIFTNYERLKYKFNLTPECEGNLLFKLIISLHRKKNYH